MAQTFKRICVRDHTIADPDGTSFTLKRGEEYLTSRVVNGDVRVLSRYWVWVPVALFAGEEEFTPAAARSCTHCNGTGVGPEVAATERTS